MKKLTLCVLFALFLLPLAVMGQCGTENLTAQDAEGTTFNSVKVGPHCWLKPNLSIKLDSSKIYKSEMYPDTDANLATFGRLYDWYTAMNVQPGQSPVVGEHGFVQGICPEGWHLPTAAEARELMNHDAQTLHATERWLIPGTNTTGFTMLPGGFYNKQKDYGENLGGDCYMWSAQSLDPSNPTVIWSDCHCEYFLVNRGSAVNGMSVRCVYKIYQGEVTTDSVKEITDQSATLYGTVAFSGYDESYERGFVYGTDPDNLDQWAVESSTASDETAPFNTEITGLTVATKYYYQAYIINDFDTAWGEIKDFNTLQMQVTTDSANNITHYTATLHGNLTYLTYPSVNVGFKYGTSEDALTSISVESRNTTGQYLANLEGLTEGTTYFFKAFAANGTDTVYGEVKDFTTKYIEVETSAATNIRSTAATLNGELTKLKDYENANVGFRYGQHKDYMVFFANEKPMTSTGSFDIDLSNISPNTTYFFQAYAYNETDTAWAVDTLSFRTQTVPCLGAVRTNEHGTTDAIDSVIDNEGNAYIAVKIGTQCWMAENLRATKYQNSEVIDNDIASTDPSTTEPKMYYPKGQSTLVDSLGYLYNYPAVVDSRNICPEGWHIPTDSDWFVLEKEVLGLSVDSASHDKSPAEVGKLAGGSSWTISANPAYAGNMTYADRNKSGFAMYPAHYCGASGFSSDVEAYFWSSTAHNPEDGKAWGRAITSNDNYIYRWPGYEKSFGFSVRCLRDEEEPPFTCGTSKVKDVDNNEYNTVKIGNQCWMKENLRTKTKRNNVGNIYTNNTTEGYNAETYGYYYDWEAVMQNESGDKVQGICPEGWHVPSDAEWDTLTNYVSSQSKYLCGHNQYNIAKALASATGWESFSNNCTVGNKPSDNNATGFAAVPAGYYYGAYDLFDLAAFFWSATQNLSDYAYYRGLYYYAANVVGDSFSKYAGCSVRCLKDAEVPAAMSVTTDSANTVTKNTATLHGTVTNMGGKDNVNVGFKYGTSESALTSIVVKDVAMAATGLFSCDIDGLAANTQYYFKAFAANGTDTVYGEVKNFKTMSFSCLGTPKANERGITDAIDSVVDVDGNAYTTVQIGTQCWMAENLRTTKYADGTAIVKGSAMSRVMPYRYFPGNDTNNVNTYGHLYNWMAVMNGADSSSANPSGVQGICPDGWHVPSNAEWNTLTQYVYNSDDPDYKCSSCESSGWIEATKCIGRALADTTGWDSNTSSGCNAGNTGDKANATGFSAVPAGGIHASAGSAFFGQATFFWSATYEATPNKVHVRSLSYSNGNVSSSGAYDSLGLSVRCLRDPLTVTTDSANTVTNNTATLYGTVTNMGGKDNVYAGFKYGTSADALTSIISNETAMAATGMFSCDIAGLTANTQYYFKAFAANGTDTVYGATLQFKTKSSACPNKVEDHQNNEYTVVQIGTQCWMTENLRCTTSPVGNTLTLASTSSIQFSYYQNTGSTIYNWHAAVDATNGTTVENSATYTGSLCPDGWHLPTATEWDLINGIIPAGFVTTATNFWTVTHNNKKVHHAEIDGTSCTTVEVNKDKGNFYAIRCVKSAE